METSNKIRKVYNSNGLSKLFMRGLGYIYNRIIWPFLPKTEGYKKFNNVRRRKRRIFDRRLPFPTRGSGDCPKHEDNLAEAIRSFIDDGEIVLEVATGVGITAVIAARCVGEKGRIITYEGSKSRANEAKAVVELNNVTERVEVKNSIVETDTSRISESAPTKNIIPVSELPKADVLIIDCDGCEFDILENSDHLPGKIIVEHHAVLDIQPEIKYQPDKIRHTLRDLDYDILSATETEMDESLPQFGSYEVVFVAKK